MMKIKILHIIPGFGGGISSHVRNLISATDSNTIQIDVIGFNQYPDEFVQEVKAKEGQLFMFPNVHDKGGFASVVKYLDKTVRENKYDIVHCHSDGMRALLFSIVAKKNGVKRFILHAHRSADENDRKWYGKILYFCDRISNAIAATDYASCSLLASEHIFGKKKVASGTIMHVPNGIRLERYAVSLADQQKEDYKRELNIQDRQLVIGHIGRYNYQKNHGFILDIAKALCDKHIDYVLVLVGTGELFNEIKDKAKEYGVSEHIRFLGRREDANLLYQIMDVTILPSFFEGLPTVVVESQTAGVPAVVSDAISPEVDFKMGLVKFFPIKESPEKWAEAILGMVEAERPDLEYRKEVIRKKGFTADMMAKLYEEFILGKRKSYNFEDIE